MGFKETKIIKNFDYPTACLDMNLSESGNFLVSIGTYKPSVKIHDLTNIAQKSNRHLEAEPMKVLSLTKNCEKLALLRIDRYVEFHVKYGMHERIRMPKLCYDLKFNKFSGDIIACGNSNNIFRFNLIDGKFCTPYDTSLKCIMEIDINSVHSLVGYCGKNNVEFLDQRSSKIVSTTEHNENFLHMAFSNNGINFVVGTENGEILVFDLRSRNPLYKYNHKESVRKVKMIEKKIISIDKHTVMIYKDGEIVDKIPVNVPINTFEVNGGIIFLGLDDINMRTYYSTDFGDIPDWCNIIKVDENL